MKRTRRIKISLSEEEFELLQQRKTKPRLAEWLREVGLGQRAKRKFKSADPALLYELNKIGNNLNQIAKAVNRHNVIIDRAVLLSALVEVERTLKRIVNDS